MSLLPMALQLLENARAYTLRIVNEVDHSDWFRSPGEPVTHIAWQVGHLAMAEYRLALVLVRDEQPADSSFISQSFLEPYRRNSVPTPDPTAYSDPETILAVFHSVHAQVMQEAANWNEADLHAPSIYKHSLFTTKIEGLYYCAHHEMIHAGQIGLIRRQLGYPATF